MIARCEESYRLWYVIVCDPETSCMRRPFEIISFTLMQISRLANAIITHTFFPQIYMQLFGERRSVVRRLRYPKYIH